MSGVSLAASSEIARRWPSGHAPLARISWLWRAPEFIGRVRLRRWRAWGVVVSDVHGQSDRAMIKALLAGKTVPEVLNLASNRLRASREDIFEALQAEEITPAHRFVLTEIMAHIEELESRIARFDAELLRSLQAAGYGAPLQLLQTLPGIDLMGAAMLLVEIGSDM